MASPILPAGITEVFSPAPREVRLCSAEAELIAGAQSSMGELVVMNYRVALLGEPVTTIYLGGAEEKLRRAPVNLSYDSIVSAAHRTEKLFVMAYDVVEVSYEVQEGFVKKVLFKVKKGQGKDIVDSIRSAAAAKYRELVKEMPRLPMYHFMSFVEFLGVSKALRPLYYDSVSRCIVVGSSYFCIKDAEWRVEGSSDILPKASSWIDEYRSRAA